MIRYVFCGGLVDSSNLSIILLVNSKGMLEKTLYGYLGVSNLRKSSSIISTFEEVENFFFKFCARV
jgi:hypothetical protein